MPKKLKLGASKQGIDINGVINKIVLGDNLVQFLELSDIAEPYEYKKGTVYCFIDKENTGELQIYNCNSDFTSPGGTPESIFIDNKFFFVNIDGVGGVSGASSSSNSSSYTIADLYDLVSMMRSITPKTVQLSNLFVTDFKKVYDAQDTIPNDEFYLVAKSNNGSTTNINQPYFFL